MDRLTTKGQMIDQVNLGDIKTSSFDRANHNFLSGKLGKLIPVRIDEVYPADRIKGNIEIVANFEPLAGPILGSMVMKQESFYVPMDSVWKNAYKFFTGKGGFNSPVPAVSPRKVWTAWSQLCPTLFKISLLRDDWITYGVASADWEYSSDVESPYYQFVHGSCNALALEYTNLLTWATSHGAVDLVQPLLDIIKKYVCTVDPDDGPSEIGSAFELALLAWAKVDKTDMETVTDIVSNPYYQAVANVICEFYTEVFDFMFGPSSLLDYAGWPINDDWRGYFITGHNLEYRNDYAFAPTFRAMLATDDPSFELAFDGNLFSDIALNWLPFRAMYLCWYWNYRDQLLETDAIDPESDGFLADNVLNSEILNLTLLRVRCWYKDTYTTALTNTGDGNLLVPTLSDVSDDAAYSFYDASGMLVNTVDAAAAAAAGATVYGVTIGGVEYRVPMNYLTTATKTLGGDVAEGAGPAISLDLFDRIKRLRSFIQKRLILGYEYDDVIWSSFRVQVSNVRLRIPELLGRGRDVVDMNTIVNNTTTTEQIAGDKTAVAWARGSSSPINYFAEEHGFFITFMTIMPIQSYLGGLSRSYLRRETFDYMWPDFATMGMDAVYNAELSAPRGEYLPAGLTDDSAMAVFGYQGRYYDLKTKLDECHGRLRTDLRYMTFSREWNEDNPPKLNYTFVHCWPSLDMFVTNDPNVDVIRTIDVFSNLDWQRRLPVPSEYVN